VVAWKPLLGIPVGLALSTPPPDCAFFVPLLITSGAARSGYIALAPE
jgi:hypothetical protein